MSGSYLPAGWTDLNAGGREMVTRLAAPVLMSPLSSFLLAAQLVGLGPSLFKQNKQSFIEVWADQHDLTENVGRLYFRISSKSRVPRVG